MKNKLKALLADSRPALGSWIGLSDPYSVEMVADMGFDWLLIDAEHFPLGKEAIRNILMACKGSSSVPVVRVPVNSVEHVQSALDAGAQGVMTPMINSADDAKRAVDAARYPPLGRRGYGPIRASRYLNNLEEYRREANHEIALFLQIETPEGVKNAADILATPGVDGIFIGNGDLANFMNHGRPGSAAVREVVNRLIDMACEISMPIGLPAWSQQECQAYIERGAGLLTVGSDLGFLARSAREDLAERRKLLATAKCPLIRS